MAAGISWVLFRYRHFIATELTKKRAEIRLLEFLL